MLFIYFYSLNAAAKEDELYMSYTSDTTSSEIKYLWISILKKLEFDKGGGGGGGSVMLDTL